MERTTPKSQSGYLNHDVGVLPEPWMERFSRTNLSRPRKLLALLLAWQADRHGNPVQWPLMGSFVRRMWGVPKDNVARQELFRECLTDLGRLGWVKVHGRPDPDRPGAKIVEAIELTYPADKGARS